jgi:hypothetical protein
LLARETPRGIVPPQSSGADTSCCRRPEVRLRKRTRQKLLRVLRDRRDYIGSPPLKVTPRDADSPGEFPIINAPVKVDVEDDVRALRCAPIAWTQRASNETFERFPRVRQTRRAANGRH